MTKPENASRSKWMRSIVQRYERPLMRYAARITGDADLARDVVQEVFLRICSQDPAAMNGRVAPFLYTICRSRALDVRRKEGRMQTLGDAPVETHDDRGSDPSLAAVQKEDSSRALRVVAALPLAQQEVIQLRFQSGLSYKEIAEVTKLSVSNVGYLIHAAIKTIRVKLKELDGAS